MTIDKSYPTSLHLEEKIGGSVAHKKEEFLEEWLSPSDAARLMSRRAGYLITPEDLKLLRRHKKLRQKKLTDRISLYYREEIQQVNPPRKRNPQPFVEAEA